jgi:Domain of unknown function (DUF4402)
MSLSANISFSRKLISSVMGAFILTLTADFCAKAQEKLPHPVKVTAITTQGLCFGAFCQGPVGGSVIVSPTGSRSVTGDVVGLGMGYVVTSALFELETNPGTVIALLNGPDATLTGSAGGSLSLHIGASYPSAPLITTAIPPARTAVTIGGTLTVGSPSANPPGSYSGSFYVTFIQE